MTVLSDARIALAALIDAATSVKVSAYPMGKNEPPKECIFLDGSETRFEWRSLGNDPKNREENFSIEVVVRAYREAPSQGTAAAAALARVEELLEVVETAIVSDDFDIGGTTTMALVSEWTIRSSAHEEGWAAEGRARVTGKNLP